MKGGRSPISNLRINEQIRISPVRLIDQEKTQHGIVPTEEALRMARDAGLDLVEVSPTERPPVCRIMDYGKHKYLLSKKQKHKSHEQKLKELRIRPKTDTHDKLIKVKHARDFLKHGDRVQFTMIFKGRERVHRDIGMEAFTEIMTELADISKVEQEPKMFGRRMTMVLVPGKAGPAPKPKAVGEKSASGGESGSGTGASRTAATSPSPGPAGGPMAAPRTGGPST